MWLNVPQHRSVGMHLARVVSFVDTERFPTPVDVRR